MNRSSVRVACVCLAGTTVLAAGLVDSASGIVRRHDRPDSKYLELAEGFDAVVVLGGAAGTLVAPRWILTAAHVAKGLSSSRRSVSVGSADHLIDKIIFHDSWTGQGSRTSLDLALVRLTEPVATVEPLPIYDRTDEIGKRVLFIGGGMFGDGNTGPAGDDGRMRGATNTVDDVPARGWLSFQFDAPPDGTDLEGISGPGDSGGPALIEHDGRQWVAGVSSSNDDHGLGHCRYGTTEYYARVSTSADWLRDTMKTELDTPADDWPEVHRIDGNLPDTPAGRVAGAFFEYFADGTPEAMRAFEQAWRSESALAQRSVEDRVAGWPELQAQFGTQTPKAMILHGPQDIEIISRAGDDGEGMQRWRSFRFKCESAGPHKLSVILIGPARPPQF